MYIFDHVSLNSSKNEKCLRQKLYRKSKHTFRVQSLFIFFENRAVYETMWKNTVEPNRPHVTIGRMRIAYWVSKSANTHTHTHTHTLRICNTYSFSTATMVIKTLLSVTL